VQFFGSSSFHLELGRHSRQLFAKQHFRVWKAGLLDYREYFRRSPPRALNEALGLLPILIGKTEPGTRVEYLFDDIFVASNLVRAFASRSVIQCSSALAVACCVVATHRRYYYDFRTKATVKRKQPMLMSRETDRMRRAVKRVCNIGDAFRCYERALRLVPGLYTDYSELLSPNRSMFRRFDMGATSIEKWKFLLMVACTDAFDYCMAAGIGAVYKCFVGAVVPNYEGSRAWKAAKILKKLIDCRRIDHNLKICIVGSK